MQASGPPPPTAKRHRAAYDTAAAERAAAGAAADEKIEADMKQVTALAMRAALVTFFNSLDPARGAGSPGRLSLRRQVRTPVCTLCGVHDWVAA